MIYLSSKDYIRQYQKLLPWSAFDSETFAINGLDKDTNAAPRDIINLLFRLSGKHLNFKWLCSSRSWEMYLMQDLPRNFQVKAVPLYQGSCNEFTNVFLVKSKKISYNEVFSGKLAESTRNKNLLDEFVCKYEQLGMPQGWNVRIFLFMRRLLKLCCITQAVGTQLIKTSRKISCYQQLGLKVKNITKILCLQRIGIN